ncbi:MAG: hypothetical protein LBI31_00845 [Zoogloeaceae bacterium]|nr:hypothetical protein [Zoogloeaceae bacterium]
MDANQISGVDAIDTIEKTLNSYLETIYYGAEEARVVVNFQKWLAKQREAITGKPNPWDETDLYLYWESTRDELRRLYAICVSQCAGYDALREDGKWKESYAQKLGYWEEQSSLLFDKERTLPMEEAAIHEAIAFCKQWREGNRPTITIKRIEKSHEHE